jgi:hypothetical protein
VDGTLTGNSWMLWKSRSGGVWSLGRVDPQQTSPGHKTIQNIISAHGGGSVHDGQMQLRNSR